MFLRFLFLTSLPTTQLNPTQNPKFDVFINHWHILDVFVIDWHFALAVCIQPFPFPPPTHPRSLPLKLHSNEDYGVTWTIPKLD